jgi:putative nucleotidyltransferase with HDIG domain
MSVFERTMVLADRLAPVEARGSSVPLPAAQEAPGTVVDERHGVVRGFRSSFRIGSDGRALPIFGKPPTWDLSSLRDIEFLADAEHPIVLAPVTDVASDGRLFMGFSAGGARSEDVVWAEVDQSWLWWGPIGAKSLPEQLELVVLTGDGQVLFSTLSSPAARRRADWSGPERPFEGGRFQIGDAEYLGKSWRLPFHDFSGSPRLEFVLLEPAEAVAAPFADFLRTYTVSALLALLLIVYLSLVQIRRILVPLQRLGHAAQKVTAGNLEVAVAVESRDEFADVAVAFNAMGKRLQRQFSALQTRGAIDRAILSSLEPKRILELALDGAAGLLEAPLVAVAFTEGSTDRATIYLRRSDQPGMQSAKVPAGALGEISAACAVPVVGELPDWARPFEGCAPRSLIVAPVAGERTGLLMAGSPREHAFSDDSVVSLSGVAEQLSVALANATLLGKLEKLQDATLVAFGRTVDMKSAWTSGHSERVATYARELAIEMELDGQTVDLLYRAALVHDIGKIGVPDAVLDKPGKLSALEMLQVQEHVRLGATLLQAIPGFEEILPSVWQHHERWDGAGYPNQLAGKDISLDGRILGLVDVYDALTSPRPYRSAMTAAQAVEIIESNSGKHFDPTLVPPFLELCARWKAASQPVVESGEQG